jgi:UDP-N-acetylmuramate--alanine ligase
LARAAGASVDEIVKGLADFQGIQRRFEYKLRTSRHTVIDDYAHHPTELRAAIETARAAHPGKRLTGIFQPHLYTRTRDNADGFAEVLSLLDHAILLPIYPAREAPLPGVDSQMILEKMSLEARELVDARGIFECLKKRPPEVLLVLGAGDIDRWVAPWVEFLSTAP